MTEKYLSLSFIYFACISSVFGQHTFVHSDKSLYFRDGLELLHKEQFLAAQESFSEYLKWEKENKDEKVIDAQFYQAFCALKLRQPDADARLDKFVSDYAHHPKAATAYYDWGNQYYEEQDFERAIEYFEKADKDVLSTQLREEAIFKLGLAYFNKKQYNQAEANFNQLKSGSGDYASASSYYAGYIAYQEERLDVALSDLLKASQSPDYEKLSPILITAIYHRQKKFAELIAYSSPLLRENKNLAQINQIYLLTADACFQLKDYFNAATYFKQYLGLIAKEADKSVMYRLGISQYQNKNYQEAIEALETAAAEKSPQGQSAAYYLGLSYLKLTNKNFAATAFEQAKAMSFDVLTEQEANWMLCKLYYELERYDDAILNLKSFIDNYPQHPERTQAFDLLSKAYLYANNYKEAMAYIESLKQKTSSIQLAYQQITFSQGVDLFNAENYSQAIQMLQKSIQNPQIPDLVVMAKYWIAEAYLLNENAPAAVAYYQEILDLYGRENTFTLQSHYGLAYAYFNTEKFALAIPHFQYYIANAGLIQKDKKYLEDAHIRLADCYFSQKDYENALRLYNRVIESNFPDKDYACFQKGIILSLSNRENEAKANYDVIMRDFPNSIYYDEALYQKALLELNGGSYAVAINNFSQLIREKPGSKIVPDALLKRALAYTNIGKNNEAIEDYKYIIQQHTTQPAASSALIALQELLRNQGRDAEMQPLLETYRKANPESQASEKIYFENAKATYSNQQYPQSVSLFNQYLTMFPQSAFSADARFFLAESYFRLNESSNAIKYYQMVVQEKKSAYLTRSALRVADLEYQRNQYRNALNYYQFLATNTPSKREQIIGWTGMMQSYFELRRYDSLNYYADEIIKQSNEGGIKSKAFLFKGKAANNLQQLDKAIQNFQLVAASAIDENGAEAQYWLGDIFYKQQKYKQSLETLFELNKKFNQYEKWRGRGFLLIADNYIALNELFQAKATLQSIIDKSPDKLVVQQAQQKLNALQKK